MAKRTGYDPTNPSNKRSKEERDAERAELEAFRRAQREPYDVKKEVVVRTLGDAIAVDRDARVTLHVEITRYAGRGLPRLRIMKRGTRHDGSTFESLNIGSVAPEVATKIAEALMAGALELKADIG